MDEFSLKFDGYRMSLYKDETQIKSWSALSGKAGSQSPALTGQSYVGPIPEGGWSLDVSQVQTITGMDNAIGMASAVYKMLGREGFGRWPGGVVSWGVERVDLVPATGTSTLGRDGFTIHGGEQFGSAGCIDWSAP